LTIQALKDVGMPDPDKIHLSYPHELSGGQRQRVMIAMALILGPKLLIADEPTTALDVTTQKQILALIKKLQKERGTSVIFVTHDFGVVADIADRILVMRKGDQVEIGKALDILSAPQHDYTRSLIACVPNVYPPVREKTKKDSVIIIESLFKRYGKKSFFGKSRQVNALNDINLDIYRDEITSVVGESGSGKSTLARCLMGLVEPSEGTVRLDGRPLAPLCRHRSAQQKKRMQIVFQDPYRSLNPRLTIGTSLSEGLTNLGISGPDAIKKITNVLEIVGLDASCLERFPHQFSGGQRQRLCLARAIVMEPEVLICDESVSALDVLVQEQVLALLLDIKKKTGVSIIFITHDLRVASQISDRIIVMQKGKVIEDDVPSKIIFEPNSAYTKELIESAPGRHWDFKHFQPAKVAIA
jgi:peptide/nickel transport system ATP-binding protein